VENDCNKIIKYFYPNTLIIKVMRHYIVLSDGCTILEASYWGCTLCKQSFHLKSRKLFTFFLRMILCRYCTRSVRRVTQILQNGVLYRTYKAYVPDPQISSPTSLHIRSSIFWDTTPCSPVKAIRRFEGTCVHGWSANHAKTRKLTAYSLLIQDSA
jgi:hypothetical protein